ncbi:MAG: LamG-like jellyroll fold domain-containing protein [Chloroflexota bacterium]
MTQLGVFLGGIAGGALEPGSEAFNRAIVNMTLMIVASLVLIAIAQIPVVGQLLVALIVIFDTVANLICGFLGVSGGVCNGVVGTVVAAIADFFYGSEEPAVDLQHKDRLQINGIDFAFDPPGLGASKTSTMTVTADVTTRVFATNHEFYKVLGSRSFGRQRTSTFVYKLAFNKLPDFHDSLNKNEMGEPGWMFDEDKHVYAANRLPATDYVLSQSGVNAKMPSLWLAEGYAIETTRCILGCIFNRVGTDRGTFHHVLSRDLYIDVFPETLDEFMTFAWDTGIPFPVQVDRDGDGLRTNIAQTNDPDDTTPDTDGDGLSDFYEIHHGTSETRADSDSDGLSDYEELRYRTSSANRDSDGDGLSDLEEVTGWEFIYYEGGSRQIMLVTSDPLQPDTDGDGLSDFAEFQYRLNPRAAGSFGSFSFAMSPPEPYIFVDGSTIDYEATATNSLPAGRTAVGEFSIALEDEIPDQQTAAFAIGASDSQTFSGQLTLNASAMITGQLDIEAYAGGVVGELVAQPAYPDNMILYYPFDDVGVDKLKSSVGPNSFECNDDCALYYSQLDGVVGRGLYVDTDIVTAQTPTIRAIDDTVSLSAAGTTVGFWLRPDAPGNFLTFENNNGPGYLWMRMTGGSRNLDIYTSSCRGTVGSTSSNVVLPLNEWNHVVVSFRAETPDIPKNIEPPDRSSGINIRYFEPTSSREVQAFDVWLNGVHVDTDTIDALINGCGFTQLQLAPSFRGSIDELFVLNGSLAPNDTFVPALYNYQRSWFQEYATETIFVDNENPSVWFKGVENIPVSAESHIIQIEAVDHVGGSGIDRVEYRLLPDGLWQPATRDGEAWFFSHDLSIGNPLVHFELRAFDRAGNSSEDGGSETNWTVSGDLFGPMVVVQRYTVRSRGRSASAQGLEDGFLEISGTYSDDYSVERLIIELLDENGDLFGIPVQTAGNGDGTWNVDYPIPAEVDGSYTVRATAVDFVGNETVALSNGPVFGDATAPVGAVSMLDETAGLFHGTVSDFRQPTNPTVHFHFEEAAGATTFYDSSIRQLNATCTTCPTADQAGHTGQAIAFNGVDQVIEVPYQDDLLFGGSFGFSGWFHLNSNSSQPLVQHNGFSLRTNADGTLFAAMATLPNNEYLLNTPTVVPTNAWFHLAMTWRAGEDAVVYLDGTQVTSFATDGIELDNGVEPTLMLGSNGFTFMNGLVDDVRLYKRPFTPTDINLLANQAGSNVAQAWIGYAHMQDGFETASQAPNFWQPITLDTPNASFSTWTAPVPLGLEGIYDIALKISDSEGNERVMESVWNTAFDSLAPRMTLGGDVFTPWSIFSGIQITDFNLLPVDENLSNDPVWNYYVQNSYLNDSWYTDFTDEKRLYEMNSFGQLVIPRQPADALRACDSVGNCTTAVPLTSGIISLIHDVYPGNAAEIAIDTPLSNRLSFGTVGSGNGQLSTPQVIEVGPINIFVAYFVNNRVQIFDLSGNYVDQIAVNLPKDIALDPVTEDIYVAGGLSAGFNFVRKFDQNGTQLGNWFFPVLIDAVATDEAGNVYVSDLTNCNILKFDNSFTQIDTWGTTCGAEFSSNIRSIAVDRADYGSLSGYDDSKNNVYILDSRAVKRYTSDGTFVSQFVLPFSQADGGGVAPNAIAVDWRGDLYVADYSNNFNNDAHRIQKFSPDGVFLGSWGEKGFAPGEMNGLSGVAVGLGDSLYVVEEVGHRIQQLPIVPHHAALDDIYPDDGDAFISAVSTYLPDSGIYAFTASLPAGMTLQDISCMSTSGAASTLTNVATGQLTLNYTAGDGYICTFTSQANGGSVANMVQTVTHIETEAAIAERSSQLAAPRSYLLTSGGTNSLDPVDFQIFGDTDAGLQGISLWEGANQIGLENWGVGERDSQLVTFSWTPPAEGQYDLVSIVEDWNNVSAVNPAVPFLVDVTSPSLSLSTASVSSANMNEDGFITVNGSVSDNLGLAKLEIAIDNGDWQEVALPTSGSNFSVTVNGGFSELPESGNIIIEGRATDKVGNVTTDPFLVPIDAVPPVLVDITLRRDAVNGPIVEPGSLIADTATPTLWLNWTASSDASGIARYWVGWTDSPDISDVTGLTEFSNATTDASFPLSEISRKFAHVVAEDTFGNRSFQTIYSPIYVDQQQTPDYINMDENGIPYRNWVNNGCGLVGVDYRADRAAEGRDEFGHPQGLAVTWDATDLRLNWSGANWRTDGDLFIYLDTAAGGSDRAYNPYPASQSDTVIILPVDESSQMLADYVIWVEEDGNTATLLAWNGSSWVAQPSNVWDYFFDVNTAVPQTDIAIPFAQLGIANPAASSLSLVAFASEEDRLRLWATSPASNFVNSEQVLDIETDQYLHLFALTERYEWASLGSGVCPNANQPEPTADLQFTLSSDQAGTSYNPLADGLFFAMRDLSLYQNLINWQAEWNAICANNSGHQACEKANPFDTSSLDYNSTQGLQTVEDTNHEPLGNGDTVNYTLHATNFGDATATAVSLTVQASGPLTLDGGGTQLVLNVGSLAPGQTAEFNFGGTINTGVGAQDEVAAIDVTITQNNRSATATVDSSWISLDIPVDANPPRHVEILEPLGLIGPNVTDFVGVVADDGEVPTLELRIQESGQPDIVENCTDTTPVDGAWVCQWDAGGAANDTVYTIDVRATDDEGLQSAYGGARSYIVDAQAPTVAVDASPFTAGLVGLNDDILSGTAVDNRLLSFVEVCEVDGADENCELADFYLTTPTEIVSTFSYPDAPASPIAIDAATSCGGSEIVRTFNVTDSFVIDDVNLGLNIDHAYRADVVATLTSPAGTAVVLLSGGLEADNYDVLLDDSALQTAVSDGLDHLTDVTYYENRRAPQAALTAFNGENSAGTWSLAICDADTGMSDGAYNHAELQLQAVNVPASTDGAWSYVVAWDDADDGTNKTFRIYATDSVGNRSVAQTINFDVDLTPPTLVVNDPAGTLPIDGTANDASGVAEVSIGVVTLDDESLVDDVTLIGNSWSYETAVPLFAAGGASEVWITAVDNAGNTSSDGPYTIVTDPVGPGGVGQATGEPDLALWLRADRNVTMDGSNAVSNWGDFSGYGRDATQATGNSQPLFVADGLNGEPTLRFDGIDDFLDLAASSIEGVDGFTVFSVFNWHTASTWQRLWDFGNGTGSNFGYLVPEAAGSVARFGIITPSGGDNRVDTTTATPTNSGQLLSLDWPSAGSASLARNGGNLGSATVTSQPSDIGTINHNFIGKSIWPDPYLDADIAEFIIFHDTLTAVEQTHVELYLQDKYSLDMAGFATYQDGGYNDNVQGISQSAQVVSTSGLGGLQVNDDGFLQEADDLFLVGHDGNTGQTTNDSPSTLLQRWNRIWKGEVNDAGSNNGTVDLLFDYSDSGIEGLDSFDLVLLTRAATSGDFTIVSNAMVDVGGSSVLVTVDLADLDTYFTIGEVQSTWTVCSTGCDYTTIQAAINAPTTLDGHTIVIVDPVHTEHSIVVSKDLTIRGLFYAIDSVVQAAENLGDVNARVFTVNAGKTVRFEDLTIQHGYFNNGVAGAGIYNNGGDVTILRSIIRNNRVEGPEIGGGIISVQPGSLTIGESSIINNHADRAGGGIATNTVDTIYNSTISGNSSNGTAGPWYGGGLYIGSSGNVAISYSTIAANTAKWGGGIGGHGNATLVGSIVAGNSATDSGHDLFTAGGSYTSGGYNVIGRLDAGLVPTTGDQVGSDATPLDPMLATLGNSGDLLPVHPLLDGSPAIDNGDGTVCLGNLIGLGDQNGRYRFDNSLCDSGAYEADSGPVFTRILAALDGLNLVIDWWDNILNNAYEIHSSTTPYFEMDETTLTNTLPGPINVYTITNGANETRFYRVNITGGEQGSLPTNEIGVFTFDIVPGN